MKQNMSSTGNLLKDPLRRPDTFSDSVFGWYIFGGPNKEPQMALDV